MLASNCNPLTVHLPPSPSPSPSPAFKPTLLWIGGPAWKQNTIAVVPHLDNSTPYLLKDFFKLIKNVFSKSVSEESRRLRQFGVSSASSEQQMT